jgi:hypothetical protein
MSVGKNMQVSWSPHVGGASEDAAHFDGDLREPAGQVAIYMQSGWFLSCGRWVPVTYDYS